MNGHAPRLVQRRGPRRPLSFAGWLTVRCLGAALAAWPCASPAAAAWSDEGHADLATGRVDHVLTASDPSSGGMLLMQCVRGVRTAFVSVNDDRNAFHHEGDEATVYVQPVGGVTSSYPGRLRAKRDGRVVFEVGDRSFPDAFADGPERVTVNTPYVHYLMVLDLDGTAAALAPVRACKG